MPVIFGPFPHLRRFDTLKMRVKTLVNEIVKMVDKVRWRFRRDEDGEIVFVQSIIPWI